jgi:hypothetical protein
MDGTLTVKRTHIVVYFVSWIVVSAIVLIPIVVFVTNAAMVHAAQDLRLEMLEKREDRDERRMNEIDRRVDGLDKRLERISATWAQTIERELETRAAVARLEEHASKTK